MHQPEELLPEDQGKNNRMQINIHPVSIDRYAAGKHQIPIIKTPVWDISAVFDITALTELGFYNLPEFELVEKTNCDRQTLMDKDKSPKRDVSRWTIEKS